MESVKLFYCVKLCDETDCFEKHIRKVREIQDHIKECFKAHVNRDRYRVFNHYVFWHEAPYRRRHTYNTWTRTGLFI